MNTLKLGQLLMSPVFVCFISTQSTLLGTRVPTDRMPTDVKTLDLIKYDAHSQIVFPQRTKLKRDTTRIRFPHFPLKKNKPEKKRPHPHDKMPLCRLCTNQIFFVESDL